MSGIGRRVLRRIRQFVRREKAWTPVRRTGLMFDPEFAFASGRPGERFDPLASSIEE